MTLGARWVTLRARWVMLRARWVALRARWVTLRARWVTLRARWVTLISRWLTLISRWVTLRAVFFCSRTCGHFKRLRLLPPPAPAARGWRRRRWSALPMRTVASRRVIARQPPSSKLQRPPRRTQRSTPAPVHCRGTAEPQARSLRWCVTRDPPTSLAREVDSTGCPHAQPGTPIGGVPPATCRGGG